MSLRGGLQPDEAISCFEGIASGKEQERPRNDIMPTSPRTHPRADRFLRTRRLIPHRG